LALLKKPAPPSLEALLALQVTGVAAYTQFRRFGVQVDERVTLPK
jgi:hypothetical protein